MDTTITQLVPIAQILSTLVGAGSVGIACANLLRPQDLEETEHFRRGRQEKVAKIVQCGEALAEKK